MAIQVRALDDEKYYRDAAGNIIAFTHKHTLTETDIDPAFASETFFPFDTGLCKTICYAARSTSGNFSGTSPQLTFAIESSYRDDDIVTLPGQFSVFIAASAAITLETQTRTDAATVVLGTDTSVLKPLFHRGALVVNPAGTVAFTALEVLIEIRGWY